MDAKIVMLVVVSVFAFAPEFTVASATPEYCNHLPIPGFPESNVEKWSYHPQYKKCWKLTWSGDTSVRNFFDSESTCLKTCLPVEPKPVKPYILVSGVCVCRCPKCDYDAVELELRANTTLQTKNTTTKPKTTLQPTSTTTESSFIKRLFGIDV